MAGRGMHSKWVCMVWGACMTGMHAGETVNEVDSKPPTGMHSCDSVKFLLVKGYSTIKHYG